MKSFRIPKMDIVLEVIVILQGFIYSKACSGTKGFIKTFTENLFNEELPVRI